MMGNITYVCESSPVEPRLGFIIAGHVTEETIKIHAEILGYSTPLLGHHISNGYAKIFCVDCALQGK
jgi:hypothetical protein